MLSPAERKGNFRLLLVATFCVTFAVMGIHHPIYHNFVTDWLPGLSTRRLSDIEAVRELPGLFAALLAGLLMAIAEPRLAVLSLGCMVVGFAAYQFVGGFRSLLLFSLVWSMGFHVWLPLSNGMALSLSDESNRGKRLGQMRRAGGLATIVGIALSFGLSLILKQLGLALYYPYTALYILSGMLCVVGGWVLFGMSREVGHVTTDRLLFRREYCLYYVLMFLDGCRKHIFLFFASRVLTRTRGTPVAIMTLLWLLNSVLNFSLGARVGALVDRIGERLALIGYFFILTLCFVAYAVVEDARILYVVFVVDNVAYLLNVAVTSYLGRTARKEDIRPTLAMGVTMNHVGSVGMLFVGGLLWATVGSWVVFLIGAGLALVSVGIACAIPAQPHPAEAGPAGSAE